MSAVSRTDGRRTSPAGWISPGARTVRVPADGYHAAAVPQPGRPGSLDSPGPGCHLIPTTGLYNRVMTANDKNNTPYSRHSRRGRLPASHRSIDEGAKQTSAPLPPRPNGRRSEHRPYRNGRTGLYRRYTGKCDPPLEDHDATCLPEPDAAGLGRVTRFGRR